MDCQFIKDDGIAVSTEKIFIPSLSEALEIWVYTENELFNDFSLKQKNAFKEFIATQDIQEQMALPLKRLYRSLLEKGRILENEDFTLDYQAVAVPSQISSPQNIVYLLAETQWQTTDSECFLEIEIRFDNGKLQYMEEASAGNYIFNH